MNIIWMKWVIGTFKLLSIYIYEHIDEGEERPS